MSQLHNAQQLSTWCLYFIANNYATFSKRPEFSLLTGDNLAFVNKYRHKEPAHPNTIEIHKAQEGGYTGPADPDTVETHIAQLQEGVNIPMKVSSEDKDKSCNVM